MNKFEKKIFVKIIKYLLQGMAGLSLLILILVIALLPIILVLTISEKVGSSLFPGGGSSNEDYRQVIDEWQSINHTSFDYDEMMMCIYLNENEDKLKGLRECVDYFDGNGNFQNDAYNLDGKEIFSVYKEGIIDWKGSVDETMFEDIRLPNLYQREHYKKVIINVSPGEVKEEWVLDYIEDKLLVDACEENRPSTVCTLVRPEKYVYPYQPPFVDFNVEQRYGYNLVDIDKSVGLKFYHSTVGNGNGPIQAFTNSQVISIEDGKITLLSTRNSWEFYIEYTNIIPSVQVGKEVEVLEDIGQGNGNVEVATYRIIDGQKQFINPMLFMGQPLGITGGVIIVGQGDDIDVDMSLLDFLVPFEEYKITCDFTRCYAGHTGVDIVPKDRSNGANIRAGVSGKVVLKGFDSISGNTIMIQDNASGIYIKYNHMKSPSPFSVGDVVQRGDILGQEGSTGRVTGPHVHVQFQATPSRSSVIDPRRAVGNIY